MENKSRIGIIGGGNLYHLSFLSKLELKNYNTSYGEVFYYLTQGCPLILRHSVPNNKPPHKINYQANIKAFKDLGVKHIFSFNSVGSCKKPIKPGKFLIPHDYINFDTITFYNQEPRYTTPEISSKLRNVLINILKNLKFEFKSQGVHFQTRGPRYETKAEIKLIKKFADVVGMTMGKEATLARELDLEYASLCSVDNYAHGIVKRPLTQEIIKEHEIQVKDKIEKIIEGILKLSSI